MAKIQSQEAAFRNSRKPKKVKKEPIERKTATPKGIVKNAKRNDRRKAGRARRAAEKALKESGGGGEVKNQGEGEGEEGVKEEGDDEDEEES